jgi:hypothetical protein
MDMSDDLDDPYPYDDEEPEDDSDKCQACGSHIFEEDHDWDCPHADAEDDDDFPCDGCAQLHSECLCEVDLDEVMDCTSPFHPGCRKCEVP